MAREPKFLACIHCGFLNPITGVGGNIVAKVQRVAKPPKPIPDPSAPPKVGLHEILGEHYDPFWLVASPFLKAGKMFAPIKAAEAYMAHIKVGVTDDQILQTAKVYLRLTSEPQYLKQLVNWLNAQDFLATPSQGQPDDPEPPSRFSERRHAE